jgi:hypothetical protein
MASQLLLGGLTMGRYLCIVRRDDPLLHGYVSVALSEGMGSEDEVEIIVDRRGEATDPGGAPDRIERRRRAAAERRLREEGYVVVSLDDPAGRLRSAAARRQERRREVPWRGLVAVGAGLALVIGAGFALTSGNRIADNLEGLASGWARPLSAAIDTVAGLNIWPSRAPVPTPPAPVAAPETPRDTPGAMPPKTPPTSEPPGESASAATAGKPRGGVDSSTPRDISPKTPPTSEPPGESQSAATAGKPRGSFDTGTPRDISPKTPPTSEPAGESASAATVGKPRRGVDGGTAIGSDQPPAAPALPPRQAEKRPGGLRSGTPQETEGAAGAAPDPAPLPAPRNVSRAASTAGFPGVPEVQVEWHKARDGRAIAYAARLQDEAGHPLAATEVTLLIRLPGEGVREVPLAGTGDPGTYQGRMAGADPDPDDVRVRVVLEGKRFEIPTPRRTSGRGG